MNKNYVIYTVAIIVVVAGVALAGYKLSKNSQDQSQNNSNNAMSQGNVNQIANNGQDTAKPLLANGCPDGSDVTQTDSNGRFKPTLDIANKTVVLHTSMGDIAIALYDKDAPKTVENFVCHVMAGYYDNTIFHRVAKGFVVQGGDPTGTGTGGVSVYGATFQDELYPDTPSYKAGYLKGVVAMANRGPNTNGSQFFIMLQDHPELDHNYTIFGKVVSGQNVVDKIGAVEIVPNPQFGPNDGAPKNKITILKATIK